MLFISSPCHDPFLHPPALLDPLGSTLALGRGKAGWGIPSCLFLGSALRVGRFMKHPVQAVGRWEGFSLSRVGVPAPASPEDRSWDRIVPLGFCSAAWRCAALHEPAWIRESCWGPGALINGMLLLPLPPTHFHFHFTYGTQPCNSQPGHK